MYKTGMPSASTDSTLCKRMMRFWCIGDLIQTSVTFTRLTTGGWLGDWLEDWLEAWLEDWLGGGLGGGLAGLFASVPVTASGDGDVARKSVTVAPSTPFFNSRGDSGL